MWLPRGTRYTVPSGGGRGAESIFLSKYLNPNCAGDNTVPVL